METYFFVPATKTLKIPSIKDLGVDEIIIDFEDAIMNKDRVRFLLEVKNLPDFKRFWYRIPVHQNLSGKLDLGFLMDFLALGIERLVIPKIASKEEYKHIYQIIQGNEKIKTILLIEHPRLLIELDQILQLPELEKTIFGIGLGSHDLMTFIGSEHKPNHFYYPRMKTLYLAKAFGKMAIDIASMNISDKGSFEEELLFGLEHGFDSKFIIHPIQFQWLNNYDALRNKQINWASGIIAALPPDFEGKDIEPFVLEGQIIEKPHVEKARSILKKYRNEK